MEITERLAVKLNTRHAREYKDIALTYLYAIDVALPEQSQSFKNPGYGEKTHSYSWVRSLFPPQLSCVGKHKIRRTLPTAACHHHLSQGVRRLKVRFIGIFIRRWIIFCNPI